MSTPGTTAAGTCSGYTGSIQPCPAETTVGYDCSGLTRWAYFKAFGSDVNDGATGTQVCLLDLGDMGHCVSQVSKAKTVGDMTDSANRYRGRWILLGRLNNLPLYVASCCASMQSLSRHITESATSSNLQENRLAGKATSNPVPGDIIFWSGAPTFLPDLCSLPRLVHRHAH